MQLFSRHYWHMKKLEQAGKRPQFGSYKYNAQDLVQKGVILSVQGVSPKQLSSVTIVISSNEPGVFSVEGKLLGTKVLGPEELRLEHLLQSQYDGVSELVLFDLARCNLNLLLHLLNKKFFA
jgi:Ras GTPase-activating-like protein IQGAP2/3